MKTPAVSRPNVKSMLQGRAQGFWLQEGDYRARASMKGRENKGLLREGVIWCVTLTLLASLCLHLWDGPGTQKCTATAKILQDNWSQQ